MSSSADALSRFLWERGATRADCVRVLAEDSRNAGLYERWATLATGARAAEPADALPKSVASSAATTNTRMDWINVLAGIQQADRSAKSGVVARCVGVARAQQRPSTALGEPALAQLEATLTLALRRVADGVAACEFDFERAIEVGTLGRFSPDSRMTREQDLDASLLAEYPALGRSLATITANWISATNEFIDRLEHDRELIGSFFAVRNMAVSELRASLGDSHQFGRAPISVTFDCGPTVIYKPRDAASDLAFSRLVQWLSEAGFPEPPRVPRTLARPGYGWVAHVRDEVPIGRAAQRSTLRRAGTLLAVLYATGASDAHSENVFNTDEALVLVDCETLFQPRLRLLAERAAASRAADVYLRGSVLRSNVLPWSEQAFDDSAPSDSSFVGGLLARLLRSAEPLEDLPVIEELAEFLCDGFRTGLAWILNHRAEFQNQCISLFAGSEVRVVARSTRFYRDVLTESELPDRQRDAVRRSVELEILRAPLDEAATEEDWALVDDEIAALLDHEVPRFVATFESASLRSCRGRMHVDALERSPAEDMISRLSRIAVQDSKAQVELAQVSFALAYPSEEEPPQRGSGHTSALAPKDVVDDVARWVLERVIFDEDRASWIGITRARDGRHTVRPMGAALYDGVGGVVVFLARARRSSELQARITSVIRAALRFMVAEIKHVRGIGGFSGLGSLLYVAHSARDVAPNESAQLRDAALCALNEQRLSFRDAPIDVANGLAGLAMCLQMVDTIEARGLVPEIVQRLVARLPAFQAVDGTYGMAHGSAGIALALFRLSDASGEAHVRPYAEDLLDGILRDLALPPPGCGPLDLGWCRGIAGTGLALLAMANAGFVDMGRVEPAITRIARRLNSTTEVATDSLCCGVSGHLVFLNAASAAIPDAELKDIASSRRLVLLSHAHGVRFRCVPSSIRVATPNLLQGSTGAAYALDVAGSDPLDCVLSLGYCGPRAWS